MAASLAAPSSPVVRGPRPQGNKRRDKTGKGYSTTLPTSLSPESSTGAVFMGTGPSPGHSLLFVKWAGSLDN